MQYLKGHSDRATSGVRRWRNTSASFGLVAIVFHWTIALLFLAQLALGYLMSRDIDPVLQFNLFQYHKSIGFLVLALAPPASSGRFSAGNRGLWMVKGWLRGWPHGRLTPHCCSLLLPFPLPVGPSRRRLLCRSPVTSSILSSCRDYPWRSPTKPRPSGLRFTPLWPILPQLSSFFMWQRRCGTISSAKIQRFGA